MRRLIAILSATALACALFVTSLIFFHPAGAQFRPQYGKNLASFYTTDVACELDIAGVCQQPVSRGNPFPTLGTALDVGGDATALSTVLTGGVEALGVALLIEDPTGDNVPLLARNDAPDPADTGLVVRIAGTVDSPETCVPDMTVDPTCLTACAAAGTTTAALGAGAYKALVYGELTWVKEAATTGAAGGTPLVPGSQWFHVMSAAGDVSCRSVGAGGNVCFSPCQ